MNAKEFADAMNLDGDTWQKCQNWEARKQKMKALIKDREEDTKVCDEETTVALKLLVKNVDEAEGRIKKGVVDQMMR